MNRLILGIIAVVIISAAALYAMTTGGLTGSCEKSVLQTLPSPDAKLIAVKMAVNCGATTDDATWIVLRRPWHLSVPQLLGAKENVAAFEGDDETMRWDGGTLVIKIGSAKPFQHSTVSEGVKIRYEQ